MMKTLAFKDSVLAKYEVSEEVFPFSVRKLIYDWLARGISWHKDEIINFEAALKKLNIPNELKTCNEILYRSLRLLGTEKDPLWEILQEGKEYKEYDKYPFYSWTSDNKIHSVSSGDMPHTYRLCFKHKPAPNEVVLNFKKVFLLPEVQEDIKQKRCGWIMNERDFDEVLLRPVVLDKNNLVKVIYHENKPSEVDERWFIKEYEEGLKAKKLTLKSDKEYKVQNGELTLAFKEAVISKYQIRANYQDYKTGLWVHYTKHEDLKFKYDTFHIDPIGIYFFPESFKTEGSWYTYPYKYIVRIKPDAKILDLAGINTKEKTFEFLKSLNAIPAPSTDKMQMGNYEDWIYFNKNEPHDRNWIDWGWEWLTRFFMGKKAKFTKALLDLGYDAIFDDTKSIHIAETQLIVLNPKILTDIKRVDQKSTGFKEVKEAYETILKTLSAYGGKILRETKPKKKKGLGRDPDYIYSYIEFGHEERKIPKYDWLDYGRKIMFEIRTISHASGSGKKRLATDIEVSSYGTSDAFSKAQDDLSQGQGWIERHRRDHKSWQLEKFSKPELEAFIHDSMKMLWDDKEVEKYKQEMLDLRKKWEKSK